MRFIDEYLQDKLDLLIHEAKVMSDEAKSFKLDTHAPFAYVSETS